MSDERRPEREPGTISVLVVDDSAVARRFLSTVLMQDRGIGVVTAADPIIARRKMEQSRPDVIILDIEMPRVDGLTFLREIMEHDPIPVVICSGVAGRGTHVAVEALRRGAVEIITKPRERLREFLQESAVMLIDSVYAASRAKVSKRRPWPEERSPDASMVIEQPVSQGPRERIIAIGASTGGPEAVEKTLAKMPQYAPPILVVQHMPGQFTGAFARRLNQVARISVREADDGDRIGPGEALIAPGDRHLMLVRGEDGYFVRVIDGPLVSRHRPSVDVLFRSVSKAAGDQAIGVIMTGMGVDGVQGLLEMRRAGATTLAQDEASCIVYGMPKAAIERGAAGLVVPLEDIPSRVLEQDS